MIAYIFKSSVSLLVLFGIYWIFLRREKVFVFNRFFLITAVLISFILPLISIPVHVRAASPLLNYTQIIIPETSGAYPEAESPLEEVQSRKFDFLQLLSVIYASGVVFFLLRFLININSILRLIKKSERIGYKKYSLILINDKKNPYCFFRYVFLNKNDYLEGRIDNYILRHELKHIEQMHSIDIILLEIVKILSWYNPVCLLYDRAIRINHEYLADNAVIEDNCDIKGYTEKLMNFIQLREPESVTSGYSDSNVKSRILMIVKSASGKNEARITLVTVSIFAFLILMSFKRIPDKGLSADSEIRNTVNKLTVLEIVAVKPIEQPERNVAKSHSPEELQKGSGAVIATANSNVLYRGVPNKLEIAVPGVPSGRVTASITSGSINRGADGWEAVVNDRTVDECVITVLVNNKVISEKKFIIEDIPFPIAVLVSNDHKIYKSGAYRRFVPYFIRAESKITGTTVEYSVTSFTLLTTSKTGEIEIHASGNALTDEMKAIISDMAKGSDAIFKDIKAQSPDGKIVNLSPVIIKID